MTSSIVRLRKGFVPVLVAAADEDDDEDIAFVGMIDEEVFEEGTTSGLMGEVALDREFDPRDRDDSRAVTLRCEAEVGAEAGVLLG